MSISIVHGATDQSVEVRVIDSTDGSPEAAFAYNTAGIALWYRREGGAKVAITPADLAALTTAHADGGVKYISDGYVRIDVPDAAFASGATSVVIGGSATGMVIVAARVNLGAFAPQDAAALGMSRLDAAVTTRNATTPNTVTPPTVAQMDARTLLAANYATLANQTTILNRLGAWTGTGLNTILGAFKALLSKVASAPSDIGGTFDPAADSTEALQELAAAIPTTAMRGTDNAATEAKQDTMQTAVSAIPTTPMRGTDGVDTSPMRGTDGANTVVPLAAAATATAAAQTLIYERLGAPAGASMAADIAAVLAAVGALNDPTTAAIATAIVDKVVEAEGSYTVGQILSVALAVLAGETAGSTFKTPDGVANRVVAVLNASQERTGMTVTPSA